MTARILDRGYRGYRGDRTGVRGAMRAVFVNSVQRALGMRRSAGWKVLPIGAVAIAYVPAIVYVGIVSVLPDADAARIELPTYGQYYFAIQSALVLFTAFVAPELLCTDRRTGMLGLYLSSPLDRGTYLLAKAGATMFLLALVSVGPPVFMLLAFILQSNGPDGPGGVALTLARSAGAGISIAVVLGSVSIGISSLTDRKAFATVGTAVAVLGSFVTITAMRQLRFPDALVALDLLDLPLAMAEKIHGESRSFASVPVWAVVAGAAGWTLAGAVVARSRYRSLQVTR
ncbi:MAG: hypothetical protein HYX34_06220 [Actinobacteria bacterium]|nr:hypothetical protein [Actinomycetota bacterium]